MAEILMPETLASRWCKSIRDVLGAGTVSLNAEQLVSMVEAIAIASDIEGCSRTAKRVADGDQPMLILVEQMARLNNMPLPFEKLDAALRGAN